MGSNTGPRIIQAPPRVSFGLPREIGSGKTISLSSFLKFLGGALSTPPLNDATTCDVSHPELVHEVTKKVTRSRIRPSPLDHPGPFHCVSGFAFFAVITGRRVFRNLPKSHTGAAGLAKGHLEEPKFQVPVEIMTINSPGRSRYMQRSCDIITEYIIVETLLLYQYINANFGRSNAHQPSTHSSHPSLSSSRTHISSPTTFSYDSGYVHRTTPTTPNPP
jgi:hypothetical protein